jgi:DNA-binding MarR family transcriptional regulator
MQAHWPSSSSLPPAPLRVVWRRGTPRTYAPERIGAQESRARRRQLAPESVAALADAGRTGSALRQRLKRRDIDPKLARFVLLFYGRSCLRVADIAWALGVSPSTASRWLDRAEREGLADKVYSPVDRRGTSGRLTGKGIALRKRVEHILATMPSNQRPRGVAYGIRATLDREP